MTALNKSKEIYSTAFGFHEKVKLCSYVPKKNKTVILISMMHSDMAVNDDAKKKSHIIIINIKLASTLWTK